MIEYKDFLSVEMHVGKIIDVKGFEEARNPSYQVWIDFGELGIKKSSAQITDLYTHDDLMGKYIIAVTNFPPKQIANFMSECLILGSSNKDGHIVLLEVNKPVALGSRIH